MRIPVLKHLHHYTTPDLRPLFLSVDFSGRGNFSDLPPTVGGKSLIFPRPEKSTLKKSGLKLPNATLGCVCVCV